jgi:hypothetical protein
MDDLARIGTSVASGNGRLFIFQVAWAKRCIITGRKLLRGFPYFVCNSVQFLSHHGKTRLRKLIDGLGVVYKPPNGFVEKKKQRQFAEMWDSVPMT